MEKMLSWTLMLLIVMLLVLPWLVIVAAPIALVILTIVLPIILLRWNAVPEIEENRKWSVLVADDDEVAVGPLLTALNGRAVDISFVHNGVSALTALREKKFDLLILDLMMPGLNGDHVLRARAKEVEERSSTPVIFYTGYGDREGSLRSENFGSFYVEDVWLKKLSFKTLQLKLEAFFFRLQTEGPD
jgi:CheY-like chemotaxis protein